MSGGGVLGGGVGVTGGGVGVTGGGVERVRVARRREGGREGGVVEVGEGVEEKKEREEGGKEEERTY